MRCAWLALLMLSCIGDSNHNSDFRLGAQCASDGSCPPGQQCIAGNICSRACTTPGNPNMGPSECSSNCGNNGGGPTCMFSCDIDLFCKQGCAPGGGTCTPGNCIGGNQICDTSLNICRSRCGTGADGGSCPTGEECFDDPINPGCPYCRPKGGAGTVGQPCLSGGSCTNTPGGGSLICDSVSHTCLYMCGIGTMTCSNGPNCPSGYGCDTSGNICRPLCTGGRCPTGTSGTCVVAGTCKICVGTPSNPDGGSNGATLLATTPGANHIAIDGANVYWTATSGVYRCAIGGCNAQPTQMATAAQAPPIGIALDQADTFVYWNNQGFSVAKCATLGTCGSPLPDGTANEGGGGAVAFGGGGILWSTGQHVYWCSPTLGCSGGAGMSVMNSTGANAEWITFDTGNNTFYFGDGTNLLRFDGNTVTPTGQAAGSIHGITTIETNNIFWTNDSAVMGCTVGPNCAGNPQVIASGRQSPAGIAVDGVAWYWAEPNQGQIMKCLRSGCSASLTPFITGQSRPYDVAVDATNVYWTNKGDGTVMKMAK